VKAVSAKPVNDYHDYLMSRMTFLKSSGLSAGSLIVTSGCASDALWWKSHHRWVLWVLLLYAY